MYFLFVDSGTDAGQGNPKCLVCTVQCVLGVPTVLRMLWMLSALCVCFCACCMYCASRICSPRNCDYDYNSNSNSNYNSDSDYNSNLNYKYDSDSDSNSN